MIDYKNNNTSINRNNVITKTLYDINDKIVKSTWEDTYNGEGTDTN